MEIPVKIILVNTSHPGNIGAAARAMKTMGFSQLILVSPHCFPHPDAIYRAAGANDILENVVVVNELAQALTDCQWVVGASVRQRKLERLIYHPRLCAEKINTMSGPVGIVFGRENNGLTNEELSLCHAQVCIPTDDHFGSLNVAAAVQVICYEIRMTLLSSQKMPTLPLKQYKIEPLATAEQMSGFYTHLCDTLILLDAFNPKQPKRLMQRLQLLFNRAQLTVTELNILRGILKSVHQKLE